MPFKIVRNDITKMNTEAIVNTANDHVSVGTGCDSAVYKAAGYDELLKYREENIGFVPEGGAFITPGFNLKAKYIIHAVIPAAVLFISLQKILILRLVALQEKFASYFETIEYAVFCGGHETQNYNAFCEVLGAKEI